MPTAAGTTELRDSYELLSVSTRALVVALMFAAQISHAVVNGLLPRLAFPPLPERELNAWRFDDAVWQTNTHTVPLALLNVAFVPSWSGYALRLSGSDPALAAFPASTASGQTNLLSTGSVRFWFAPDWSSSAAGGDGPGLDAVLFETGAWSENSSYVRCSLQIDSDGDAIRFVLHGASGPETILSASVQWMASEWHQAALVSSATGTVLFLDGAAVASGDAVAWLPMPITGHVNGFSVGGDVSGASLAQGNFDELYTFGRALTESEVAAEYQRNGMQAALGPIDPNAMFSSAPDPGSYTNGVSGATNSLSQTSMVAALYGCKLWLEITRATNSTTNMLVTLHNTVGGGSYNLWSKQQLIATQSWTLETNLTGASGQDWTATTVPMNGRSNLFFIATTASFFTNKSFAGLQYTNALSVPPDTMGAVGPEHFLEILNGGNSVGVFDKCSGALLQLTNNTAFFAIQEQGTNYPVGTSGDPRVLYDHESQRWIASMLDQTSGRVILAISTNSNPTYLVTNWTKYLLPVTQVDAKSDHPTLGVDKNGIYLSVLHVALTGFVQVVNNTIVAIKKPEIYQGTNIMVLLEVSTNELPAKVIQPAVNFDNPPRGNYAWFVAKRLRDYGESNYYGGALTYRRLLWNGTNASWAETNWVVPTNTAYRNYYDFDDADVRAPQTNGSPSIRLNIFGSCAMATVIRDGLLWTCQHIGLSNTNGSYTGDATGTNVDRAGAQWFKLSIDTNGSFVSLTNGRVYDSASNAPYWYYYPSLMANRASDMVMGFSGSRSNGFIAAFFWYLAGSGTTPNQPLVLRPGFGPSPNNRWGDYSYTSLDPTDELGFWTAQPYGETNAEVNQWGTWLSEILPRAPDP